MPHRLNRLLVFPLLLLAISLPLRWGHSHERLLGQQLAQHIQLFHPPFQNQSLPSGWHSHPLFPGVILEDHGHSIVFNNSSASGFQPPVERVHPDLKPVDPGIPDFSDLTLLQRNRLKSQAYKVCSTQTYLYLQILLI